MMSSFAYSWNGPKSTDDIFDYELRLNLDIQNYGDTSYVQVPIQNIIWANAIYFHQVGRLNIQTQILKLQGQQIYDYRLALESAEEEKDAYKESLDVIFGIIDAKDGIIIQERRKTRIYRTSTIVLIGVVISTAVF